VSKSLVKELCGASHVSRPVTFFHCSVLAIYCYGSVAEHRYSTRSFYCRWRCSICPSLSHTPPQSLTETPSFCVHSKSPATPRIHATHCSCSIKNSSVRYTDCILIQVSTSYYFSRISKQNLQHASQLLGTWCLATPRVSTCSSRYD
jgi:hypothetical protein